jgi:hypothetical protein
LHSCITPSKKLQDQYILNGKFPSKTAKNSGEKLTKQQKMETRGLPKIFSNNFNISIQAVLYASCLQLIVS